MADLVNPWDGEWDRLKIAGIEFRGRIEVSGTPWKKKTSHRRGRGRNGGRTVAAGWDLGEWKLSLGAWEEVLDDGTVDDSRVTALGAIIEALTSSDPTTQDATAHSVVHPAFALAGVTQVTVESADVPEITPGGMMTWSVSLKTYQPPPPRPVVRTPAPAPQRAETPPSFTYRGGVYVPHVVDWNPGDLYVRTTPETPSADP